MTDPNPQAVEAADAGRCPCTMCRSHRKGVIEAAEPHIRSQLLTELAEEFERQAGSPRGEWCNREKAKGLDRAVRYCRQKAEELKGGRNGR